jgi:hypothetical protein
LSQQQISFGFCFFLGELCGLWSDCQCIKISSSLFSFILNSPKETSKNLYAFEGIKGQLFSRFNLQFGDSWALLLPRSREVKNPRKSPHELNEHPLQLGTKKYHSQAFHFKTSDEREKPIKLFYFIETGIENLFNELSTEFIFIFIYSTTKLDQFLVYFLHYFSLFKKGGGKKLMGK